MPPKKRVSGGSLPPKKRYHKPIYLRKVPSSITPGKAPHIPTDEAPPLLPELKEEDRQELFEALPALQPMPSSPRSGVAAKIRVRVPKMFQSPEPSPLISPKLPETVAEVVVEEEFEGEPSDVFLQVKVTPKGDVKDWRKPDIKLRFEEGGVFCDMDVDNKSSWVKPTVEYSYKPRPGSPKGKVETVLDAVYNPKVLCQLKQVVSGVCCRLQVSSTSEVKCSFTEEKKAKCVLETDPQMRVICTYEQQIENKLEAATPEVTLDLKSDVSVGMEVMPDISVELKGQDFEIVHKPQARKVVFDGVQPDELEEDEEYVSRRRKSLQIKRKEICFTQEALVTEGGELIIEGGEASRDSLLLAARVFARNMRARKQSIEYQASLDIHKFEPENTGSYPPRPPIILLFKDVIKKKKQYKDLNHMEYINDWTVEPQAETVTEPPKYIERMKFTMGKVRTAFNLPLELFDNPQLDLKYPSKDLKEVSGCSSILQVLD